MSNLATVFKSLGDFKQAISLYQRDLEICETLARKENGSTPLRATVTLRNLAEVMFMSCLFFARRVGVLYFIYRGGWGSGWLGG